MMGRMGKYAAVLAFVMIVLAPGAARAFERSPHVRHDARGAVIVDGKGNRLLLRGVNVNGLVQYPTDYAEAVLTGATDAREMAALGFNFVRLNVSWSRIEPAPRRFSHTYLDRIARTVGLLEREGIYVLVDMHQDRYNRRLYPGQEADGAPDWATRTDGVPCTAVGGNTSACAQRAAEHFWSDDHVDGAGLQEQFARALLAVSRRLRHDPRLLGFDLFNEPYPASPPPAGFEHAQLWPFYRKLIQTLRRDGDRRMIWFEPSIIRDVTDADPAAARFSRDQNLVYEPHIYTDVFSGAGHPTPATPARLAASYQAALRESRAYDAALVDGEWGGGAGGVWETYRNDNLDLQDKLGIDSAFWIWKQRPFAYSWQVVETSGRLRRDCRKAQELSRPHVDAVPGRLLDSFYMTNRLTVHVVGPGGTLELWSGTEIRRGGPTLLTRPLTRVLIDGRRAAVRLLARRFATRELSIDGYLLQTRVSRGRHLVTLIPARRPR